MNTSVVSATNTAAQSAGPSTSVSQKVTPFPLTFADSLQHVEAAKIRSDDCVRNVTAAKARSRDALYELISSVDASIETGFRNKGTSDCLANETLLNQRYPGIVGTTFYHKLGYVAFGDNAKAVSAIVHVIKVSEHRRKTGQTFVHWLKAEGGLQKIRTTYNIDGTLKTVKNEDGSRDSTEGASAGDDAKRYLERARELFQDTNDVVTIPYGQFGLIVE